MKTLVLDSWFAPWSAGKVPGGAEKAAMLAATLLEGDLYTSKTRDGSTEIDGVRLIQSKVPARPDWPVDDNATSRRWGKIREAEIRQIVHDGGYELVFNNSSSASHVAALARMKRTMEVATVNWCHLSFAVSSFPRFALAWQLHDHKMAGGVNLTTTEIVQTQLNEMIRKKHDLIGETVEPNVFFDWVRPCTLDHVPINTFDEKHGDKVFSMCRWSEDKNVSKLVPMLLEFRRLGHPVEAHFASSSDLDGLSKAATELRAAGATVEIDALQQLSFLRGKCANLYLTASHTECYGIAPCEMAALGVPTVYLEKGHPHVLRSILTDFGRAVDGKTKDWATDAWQWAKRIDEMERSSRSLQARRDHSEDRLLRDLEAAAELAASRVTKVSALDF